MGRMAHDNKKADGAAVREGAKAQEDFVVVD
jgi:hypothetical protein